MRARMVAVAVLALGGAGAGCSRVGSNAWAEPPGSSAPLPTDQAGCLRALDQAQDRLHAATTVEERREAQRRLQDAQNRLLELQAEQRRAAVAEEVARLRAHAPSKTGADAPPLETASGSLEHVDAQQLILGAQGGQLQLETDGLTDIQLDGKRVKLSELPQGADVRAAFAPGSTPPVARRIDAHRAK